MIIQSLNDSIETSITLGIFKSYKIALLYHIFNGILQLFPITKCYELSNFNIINFSHCEGNFLFRLINNNIFINRSG